MYTDLVSSSCVVSYILNGPDTVLTEFLLPDSRAVAGALILQFGCALVGADALALEPLDTRTLMHSNPRNRSSMADLWRIYVDLPKMSTRSSSMGARAT